MPPLSSSARRPKLRLCPGGLAVLACLLCIAALPLVAGAQLQGGAAPARKVLSVVSALVGGGGRAPSRAVASTQKAAARARLKPQVFGCANATTPIVYGQTANGTLNAQDCTNPIDGTYYDAYSFTGVAGQQIVIDMTSTVFDTYLYLMRPGETVLSPDPAVTIQDDDSGGGTNARITITLASSGTYTILADSYGNGITPPGTGAYSVTLTQICTYALTSASRAVAASGGTFSDAYTTQAGCGAPSLVSNSAFITAGASNAPDATGHGTFSYTVASNDTTSARLGTLTVGGQTFTVTQVAPAFGALQFSPSAYSVGEGAGSVTLTVARVGGSERAVSVNYATSNGTAASGSDFTAQSGTLNFADGETTKTITVAIIDDAAVEGDEAFTVALSNPAGGATLGSPTTATVTINENDTCSFSISPTSHASPSGGDSGSLSVTAPVGCAWTATSNDAFVTINSGASGNGNGTINYSVAANPNSAGRTGTITAAGKTFTVTQSGVACTFTLSSSGQSFTPAGGVGSVVVTAAAQDCAWSATSNDGWITVNSGASSTGNGSVGYTVAANPNSAPRTGTITIAGQTYTVTQSGVTCTFSISPTSRAFGFSGGTDSVVVTAAAPDCAWTATSNDAFVTINSGASGNGSGAVGYTVAANTGAARSGTMTIAGQTFAVTQAASPGVLQFSPATYSVGEGAGSVTLTVTRTGAAGGAVSVNYSTINGTAAGGSDFAPQSGTLTFADGETAAKTITIAIIDDGAVEGDEAFTVSLSSPTGGATLGSATTATVTINENDTCSLSISPTSHASPAAGDTGSVAVTAPAGCSWAASSNASWVTITAGATGSGTGAVNYSVAANTGAARTGALTIGGQTFTVTQSFATYSISGHISDSAGGVDLSGVTVTLSGAASAATTTDAQGNYSFLNLAAGGDYNITPTKTNYSFAPASIPVGNLLGNQTINFVGTIGSFTLAGHVSDSAGGANLSGVTLALSGDVTGITTTDAQGNYSFSVAGNHSYTVTPSRAHYTFSPPSQTFANLAANQTANFTATLDRHAISGHISDGAGAALAGVAVSLTGGQTGSTTTNANGDYSFSNLAAGGSYTVTPSKSFYTFAPASRTFADLGANQTSANFTATLNRYTVSGHISVAGDALSGVVVTMSGDATGSATTDGSGNYSFASVPGGASVVLTPAKANFTFTPPQRSINIDGDRPGNDFTAAAVSAVLQFSQAQYQVSEGGGRATITVTRSGNTASTASADVSTVDNTAAVSCGDTTTLPGVAFARCDYATTVETVSFAAGETTKIISVPIIDDSYVDPGETFQLALSNLTGGAQIGQQGAATVVITDNDVAGETNPIFSTDFFVRMQYLDFLSREPEAGQPWSGVLNNCAAGDTSCDRISVSANFFRSQEFQLKGLFVFRFYKVAFNRLPHYSEIVSDMSGVTGVTTAEVQAKKAAFTSGFAQRQEFKNAYDNLSDAQFVNALMDRYNVQQITTPNPATPDDPLSKIVLTRADLMSRLGAATLTRAQVVRAVADSDEVGAAEFNPAFVAMQYFGYLRRDPEPQGFADWLRTINANPQDFRAMVNGFMNSVEYRLRFGQP